MARDNFVEFLWFICICYVLGVWSGTPLSLSIVTGTTVEVGLFIWYCLYEKVLLNNLLINMKYWFSGYGHFVFFELKYPNF